MTTHSELSVRQAEPRDFAVIERIETVADQIFIDTFNPNHWPPAASATDWLEQGGFLLVGEAEQTEGLDRFGSRLQMTVSLA